MEDLHNPHTFHNHHTFHNTHGTDQESHSAHKHHPAQAHDGHSKSVERGSGKHGESSGESDSLVHHLKKSDWQEQALKHKSSGGKEKENLPHLEISDHQKLSQTLTNAKLAPADRLAAARKLVHDGIHSVHFKDEQGKEHDYNIKLFNSGKVRVTEGNKAIVQDDGLPESSNDTARSAGRSSEAKSGARASEHTGEPESSGARRSERNGSHHHGHERLPAGLTPIGGGRYKYESPSGGQHIDPGFGVDSHAWNGVKHADGSVTLGFTGVNIDTDGRGASRHREDGHRQDTTSLARSDGQYLDTDRDNFVELSAKVAAAYGIHLGDMGWLVRKDTGEAVPVMFGDTGPNRRRAEVSVAAMKALHFQGIDGNNAPTTGQFELVMAPGSGNGRGDLSRNPQQMAAILKNTGLLASAE